MKNEIVNIYPANSLQQGFIYHALNQVDDDAYRVQVLYDYNEALDVDKFIKAWNYCIEQYPILRTAFNWEEDIYQIIYKYGKLDYQVHEISNLLTQQERDAAIEAIQVEDRKRGFDLTKPTLFRLHIIKQAEDYYTILKTVHHSITDGWSMPTLLNSFHHHYYALKENKEVKIKEDNAYLRSQDYIFQHKDTIQKYWDKSLAQVEMANDINALLSKPIDVSVYKLVGQPAESTFEIKGDIYNELKVFCKKKGITLNVIVQFIWHKLLQVYSNSTQSIVGTTISGRDLPIDGIEESVGLYINTLPLIINWDNENTIQEQLNQIQSKITELNTNSFANLVKLQKNGRNIFHTLFVFENYPVPKTGKDTSKIRLRKAIEKVEYPINILAQENDNRLIIRFQYDDKCLTEDKVNQHKLTLESIIHQILKSPTKLHKTITLLSSDEYDQIIHRWNDTDKDYPKDGTINQRFLEQVEKTPESVALVYDQKQLTYRELNEKSNQLAWHIRSHYRQKAKQDLVEDTLIALYMDRSLEMVIGILAVLKAGGAYVPMDTSYPQERVDYILADTNAEFILSQKHLCEGSRVQLPQDKTIQIDLTEKLYEKEDISNLPQHYSRAKNLAYIIYTSGTTGKPKGVMVEHSQVVSFAIENNYISNEKVHVVAGISNYAFDGSIFDLFFSLLNGKKLVLIDSNSLMDLIAFDNQLIEFNVDTIFVTTALFNSLVQNQAKCLVSISQVLFGGEACSIEIVNKFKKVYNKSTLIHVYGPTENIVYATYCPLNDYDTKEVVPIGVRLSDKKLFVLDKCLCPIPIGVIGELYIGGVGVARGYLKRSELTQKRFISNPFAAEKDKENGENRLYKTGDLVRWLPDGNLEFVGRNDDQVKIRGFRIELGEIEHFIAQIPGIKQVCVLAKEQKTEAGNNKYIVAYYVLDDGDDRLTSTVILNRLSHVLPEYMVPNALVLMESFPLNVNGKLDKRVLPNPDFILSAEEHATPTTEIEVEICQIWQQVLNLKRVGITDSFFKIGGNSILAIQVSHRMSKLLGYNVKVADIFQYKTINGLLENIALTKADSEGVEMEF